MLCIEDVLHMVIRALSEKPMLASFLDQVQLLGGCHIFVNVLQRCVLNFSNLNITKISW